MLPQPTPEPQSTRRVGVGIDTSRYCILYRVIDPCVMTLLDQGLCLMEDADDRTTRPALNGR
jgi:hypothetical protein